MATAANGANIDEEVEIKYGRYTTDTGAFYYELGGSQLTPSAYAAGLRAQLRLQANGVAGYTCGNFDAFENIENILNDLKKSTDNLGNTLVSGVKQGITALPMYLLYQASPTLAQVITNVKFNAEEAFKMSMKTCEQIEDSVLSGSGYGKFIQHNLRESLSKQAQQGKVATDAIKAAQIEGLCPDGMTWVGGVKAGGVNNKAIDIEGDVAGAGYNILRDVKDLRSMRRASLKLRNNPLFADWQSPVAAKQWIRRAIGGSVITICDDSGNQKLNIKTAAGKGLMSVYDELNREYLATIIKMIDKPAELSKADTNMFVSANLSAEVIGSIKNMSAINREATIKHLASEYAMQKTIEQALNAKRLLRVGMKDADIEAITPAQEHIDKAIAKLDVEIGELYKNSKMKQQFVFPTVLKVLNREDRERLIADKQHKSSNITQPDYLEDGAVRTK